MSRLAKIVLPALLVLMGIWLAISGLLSFSATKIGGMWLTTTEKCFFVPDIGGWIGRIWQAGVAISGVILFWFGAGWLFVVMKPDQACACLSGQNYRQCCLRRERAYLIVGSLTVCMLAGAWMLESSYEPSIGIMAATVLAFWLVRHHYGRGHPRAKSV